MSDEVKCVPIRIACETRGPSVILATATPGVHLSDQDRADLTALLQWKHDQKHQS